MPNLTVAGLLVLGILLYAAAVWAIDKIATKYLGQ
jgi:hypothetical protein